jgi:AcrR family transcriptional regulator
MGTQERKEREKNERRASIIKCAKELILEYGAEKVSMLDIAEKAELSKGTLYIYFPSKEELYKEICNEAANRFLKFFSTKLTSGLSSLEMLKLYWLCYVEMFGESEDMLIIFSMKDYIAPAFPFNPFEDKDEDSSYVFYVAIKGMIQQGINEGIFDPNIKPSTVARTMLSLFSYIVENIVKMPKNEQKALYIIEEVKSLFEIILRGIAKDGSDLSLLILPTPSFLHKE